jgi:hypothetical protein
MDGLMVVIRREVEDRRASMIDLTACRGDSAPAKSSESAAGDGAPEIGVTAAMIIAGVDAVARINWELDSFEEMAIDVYKSMEKVRVIVPPSSSTPQTGGKRRAG